MKKLALLIKILVALIVVAILVFAGKKAIEAKKAKESKTPVAKVYPIYVHTIKAHKEKVVLTLPYLATAKNANDLSISSKIPARVLSIKSSGDSVKKGEVIAKLDISDIKAQINSIKISLKNLLLTHKRSLALFKAKGLSIEQLQKEDNEIANLKSKLKSLNNQLSYGTIISPIDGIVSQKIASVGEVAMPGKPLLNIKAKSGFYLLLRLSKELNAKDIIFNKKIYKLENLHSTYQGLAEYKAYVDGKLNSGELVDVDVVVFDGDGYLLPFDAILNRDGKSYYFVAQKDKAIAKEAKIVAKGEQGVILNSLKDGENIIVQKADILLKLLSGTKIAINKD
jgi:multidrug efflux pump subunit AcrA (membrane-fusion protein)